MIKYRKSKKPLTPGGQLAIWLFAGGFTLLIGLGMFFASMDNQEEAQDYLNNGKSIEGKVSEAYIKEIETRNRRRQKQTVHEYYLVCRCNPAGEEWYEESAENPPTTKTFEVDKDLYQVYQKASGTNEIKAEFLFLASRNDWQLKNQLVQDESSSGHMMVISPAIMLLGLLLCVGGLIAFKVAKRRPAHMHPTGSGGVVPNSAGANQPVSQSPMNPNDSQNQQRSGVPQQGAVFPSKPGAAPPSAGPRPMKTLKPLKRPPPSS